MSVLSSQCLSKLKLLTKVLTKLGKLLTKVLTKLGKLLTKVLTKLGVCSHGETVGTCA